MQMLNLREEWYASLKVRIKSSLQLKEKLFSAFGFAKNREFPQSFFVLIRVMRVDRSFSGINRRSTNHPNSHE